MKSGFQLADYLTAAADVAPDKPCFLYLDRPAQTFRETEARVSRLANALLARGIGRGDRVAILALDSSAYAETIFACLMLGAAFVPLNNRLRAAEVEMLLGTAQPQALFVCGRYHDLAREVAPKVSSIQLLCSFDGGDGFEDFETLLAGGSPERPDVPVTDEDISAIVFTSGTTGLPKGVVQTQKATKETSNAAFVNFELQWEGGAYSGSPYFHVAGYGLLLANLVSRSATFVLPQFHPEQVLKAIGSGQISFCLFVPTMVTMLLEHPDCATTDFSGLRTIMYGAAPMPVPLLRRAMSTFGCDFVQVFGAATESGTQAVLTSADHRRALIGEEHLLLSVGRPALGVRMKIVDKEGCELPRGEVGEIVTQSDQVMREYLDLPQETARAKSGSWFWGGDLGRMDEQGYLYLSGRSKDMIIRGGENIYPFEIEAVLAEVPGILLCGVIGEPDERWGEIVVACLKVNEDFPGVEAALAHCCSRLARYKVPVWIELIETMPMTGSAKVSKPDLRAAGHDGRRSRFGAVSSRADA